MYRDPRLETLMLQLEGENNASRRQDTRVMRGLPLLRYQESEWRPQECAVMRRVSGVALCYLEHLVDWKRTFVRKVSSEVREHQVLKCCIEIVGHSERDLHTVYPPVVYRLAVLGWRAEQVVAYEPCLVIGSRSAWFVHI